MEKPETPQQKHARLKREVIAWMNSEGKAGRLRNNCDAPMWRDYEEAVSECLCDPSDTSTPTEPGSLSDDEGK